MNGKSILFLVVSLTIGIQNIRAYTPLDKGKEIFSLRCAACHHVNKELTGPALAGVDKRRSMNWIVSFVRSSQTLVKSGDKEAITVYEKYNKIPMPDHTDLTEESIQDIIAYIKSEAKPDIAIKVPFAKPAKWQPNYLPLSIQKDYGFFISFLIVVGVLIGVMLFAVHVSNFKA